MKKFIVLLTLLLPSIALAAVDTMEGTALSTIDTIEGSQGYDTVEGSSSSGGVSAFFETDWTTNSPGADDERCSTAGGCPDVWDGIVDAPTFLSISGGDLIATVTADTTNSYLYLDDGAGQVLNGQSIDEIWNEFAFEITIVTGLQNGGLQINQIRDAGTYNPLLALYILVSSTNITGYYVRYEHDAGTDNSSTESWSPSADTEYIFRCHYKKDSDGGADVGGDDGVSQCWVVGGTTAGIATIDNDGTGVIGDQLRHGHIGALWGGTDYTITYRYFKLYTTDPGW